MNFTMSEMQYKTNSPILDLYSTSYNIIGRDTVQCGRKAMGSDELVAFYESQVLNTEIPSILGQAVTTPIDEMEHQNVSLSWMTETHLNPIYENFNDIPGEFNDMNFTGLDSGDAFRLNTDCIHSDEETQHKLNNPMLDFDSLSYNVFGRDTVQSGRKAAGNDDLAAFYELQVLNTKIRNNLGQATTRPKYEMEHLSVEQNEDANPLQIQSAYIPITSTSRIIYASSNQANSDTFTFGYAGVQCFTMALANIIRAALFHPTNWNSNVLDENMVSGEKIYADIREQTAMNNEMAFPIAKNGHLELRNLDIIKNHVLVFDHAISLDYSDNWLCQGNLIDCINDGVSYKSLLDALTNLFSEHNSGIIVALSMSLGLMHYDDKYYFTDSHSCGVLGAPWPNFNIDKACVIECDTIEELHRICRLRLPSENEQFSIHYINVNLRLFEPSQIVQRPEIGKAVGNNRLADYYESQEIDTKTPNSMDSSITTLIDKMEYQQNYTFETAKIQSPRKAPDSTGETYFKSKDLDVEIKNTVGTFSVACTLNTKDFARISVNTIFKENPRRCLIRLKRPNIKACIYETGTVKVWGNNEMDVRIGGRRIARLIQKLGNSKAKFQKLKFHNVMGIVNLRYKVQLNDLHEQARQNPSVRLSDMNHQEGQQLLKITFIDSNDYCTINASGTLRLFARSEERIKLAKIKMISILAKYFEKYGTRNVTSNRVDQNFIKSIYGPNNDHPKTKETGPERQELFSKMKRNNKQNRIDDCLARNRYWLYPKTRNIQNTSKPRYKTKAGLKAKKKKKI
ncbi:hypothetical protein QYM36_011897 [Artemia franciscana]|uniref:Uncharacterized protein n=1 Tax=Artemia franciscana TaxID=6661 RepID=A0AA88KWY4_ARTSF|nr:hypothetical protein QYM36_011897 [Artemia franciscana]